MMKYLAWLCAAIFFAAVSCSKSGKSSGADAQNKFVSRTGTSLSNGTSDWDFAHVKIGDSYGEYFRFKCTHDIFLTISQSLSLKKDQLPKHADETLWSRSVTESNPNDPAWWKLASKSQSVYHKEDYSNITNRSVMAFWWDEESGFAFMRIHFLGLNANGASRRKSDSKSSAMKQFASNRFTILWATG